MLAREGVKVTRCCEEKGERKGEEEEDKEELQIVTKYLFGCCFGGRPFTYWGLEP